MSQDIYMISIKQSNAPGTVYVGRSGNAINRFRQHKQLLKSGGHHCKELQAVFDSVDRDEEELSFQLLERNVSDSDADSVETKWIHTAIKELGKDRVLNSFIPKKSIVQPTKDSTLNQAKSMPELNKNVDPFRSASPEVRKQAINSFKLVKSGSSINAAIMNVTGIRGGRKWMQIKELIELLQQATSN